ncbi:MAG: hypothetical protein AAF411_17480 [Myxococcota bacterium]
MEASTLSAAMDVLAERGGLSKDGTNYRCGSDHRLSFYIGQPGHAMVLKTVETADLQGSYAVLDMREEKGTMVVDVDAVHAVALGPAKPGDDRKAGF